MKGKSSLYGAGLSLLGLWHAGSSAALAQGIATAAPAAAESTATTAATGPNQSNTGLEEIVVTAQKRENRVNDVPMSITALGGEALAKAGVKNVNDLTRLVPGFQAAPSGFGQPVYFLRGIGFFDTSLQAKPAVTVYTDEQPYPYSPLSAGVAFDNERVEVLKGPQGLLFGSNSTGGTINFIASKPTKHLSAGFDASYGRFNDSDLGGFVSGPVTDTLSVRLALRHESADAWQRPYTANSGSSANGAKDFSQGRFIADWHPTSALKVELNLNGFLDHGSNQASQFLALFPQTKNAVINPGLVVFPSAPHDDRAADGGNNVPLKKDNRFGQANLRIDYKLADTITLTSLSSYDSYSEDYGVDLDGTPYADNDYRVTGHVRSFNQEARLAGNEGRFHWILGGNYENSRVYESQDGLIYDSSSANSFLKFGLPAIYDEIDNADDHFKSYAAFGNIDYDLNSRISLHAGVRRTHTVNDFDGCLISSNDALPFGLSLIHKYSPPVQPGQCIEFSPAGNYVGLFRDRLVENNTPWRIGIDWRPGDKALIYANISRGFKSGGFPNLGATNTIQYTPVKQEQVTAYEVGFKKTLLDNTLQLNAALFYDAYLNKQLKGKIVDKIFGPLNAIINIPKSDIKGAEAQIVWRPIKQLTLNGGATYLDTRVKGDYFGYTYSGALLNFKDEHFPFTPKWQVNGDAEYDADISARSYAFLGGTATYRSATSSEFIPAPIMAINSYALIDLRAGVAAHDGRWRLQVSGYNVTNKYYWTQVGRIGDAITRLTGMPATYSISLSIRY